MLFFLVGGSIRDKLLGKNITERDWIVIKSNFKFMFKLGFKLVGKDFPVFLHPITKEEYALARKEKKTGHGYHGFLCYFSKNINLKHDLFRRDLNINSLTLCNNGYLNESFLCFNYFKIKKISHISYAFSEDPLRILRLSRFFVKYYNHGFLISSFTYFLIKHIIKNKELNYLVFERILKEFYNSFKYNMFFNFFNFLFICNGLIFIFYDLNNIFIFSKNFFFNPYLNLWNKLCKISIIINNYSNNNFIKLFLLFYNFKNKLVYSYLIKKKYTSLPLCYYKTKFSISKKNFKFLKMLFVFKIFYYNFFKIKIKIIIFFLKKINIYKEKIKIINLILLNDINLKLNNEINFFYKKYIILHLFDYLNKNIHNKNKTKSMMYFFKKNKLFFYFKDI